MSFFCLGLVGIAVSCSIVEEEHLPDGPLPKDNGRIVQQHTYGDSTRQNVFWEGLRKPTGEFLFLGSRNETTVIGELTVAGAEVWSQKEPLRVRELVSLPNGLGSLGDVSLLAGWQPVDGFVYAAVGVFSGNTMVAGFTLVPDTLETWINDIAVVSATRSEVTLVAVGGSRGPGSRFPMVYRMILRSDLTLTVVSEEPVSSLPGTVFGQVELTSDGKIFVSGSDSGQESAWVWSISDSSEVISGIPIMLPQAVSSTVLDLDVSNDRLYAVGQYGVVTNGETWTAGLAACIDTSGQTVWSEILDLSARVDRYWEGFVDGGRLYAAGEYASFYRQDTQRQYGLGLLTSFDAASGDVDFHVTIGDQSYSSTVFALHVEGDRAFCFGETRYGVVGYGSLAWFTEIDMSGAVPTILPETDGRAPATAPEPASSALRRSP